MSRLISNLLGAKEPLFGMAIKQLENLTGRQAIDIKLSTEIINSVRLKISQLNFDPADTTGEELYVVLQNKLKRDDAKLLQIAGMGMEPASDELNRGAIKLLQPYLHQKCWLLKKSVAKDLLRALPPKNVMSVMGYKSIESMLKTENVLEIFAGLRFAESPAWLTRFLAQYKTISASDFELREIELVAMPDRWEQSSRQFIKLKKHNLTHLKELGVIAILPDSKAYRPGRAITLIPLIIHYINEIKLYSSYLKLHQVQAHFGELIKDVLMGDAKPVANIAGSEIHWRIIQRYYGKLDDVSKHPEIFEPHVQPEDLHWRKAEEILYELDPELGWWRDLDYIGIVDEDIPVTLNLMDNAISLYNHCSYDRRNYYHFRESLWNELFIRYMGEQALESQLLQQLNLHLISPEKIKTNRRKLKI